VIRASVLIPTHDHASTLPLAVESALSQTVQDLEVLIVGDGVTEEVREIALALQRQDGRVRFLDFAKGPHHGEIHRHTAIQQSAGEIIAYLCDDDLLMPLHVADMVEMLKDHDLAQCLNGFADPSGRIGLYSGSLEDPRFVAQLNETSKMYNFVGITGTAHTREFYERAGTPWETTPPGIPPDQHQWRRMLLSGEVRGKTSRRMTVIGLPTSQGGRDTWTPEERLAELELWAELMRSPTGQEELDRRVGTGAVVQLNEWTILALELRDRAEAAERRVESITASRWWRLGKRLRPRLSGREQ
jgi:hypothetical protein